MAAALGALIAVGAVLTLGGDDDPPAGPPGSGGATTDVEGGPNISGFEIDGGASVTADPVVTVSLSATGDADEVQIDVDPTFSSSAWQPIAEELELTLHDSGYQNVFARARRAGGAPSGIAVAGIDVDLTWDAATASADDGRHRASWARLVRPDVLQVRIETGRVVWNGAAPDDILLGRPLDTSPLHDATGFSMSDSTVLAASRISRPFGATSLPEPAPMIHDFYLTLAAPLALGVEHELTFAGGDVEPLTFIVDERVTVSPAVHLNQIGFAPDDAGKVALVSAWTGDGGGLSYADSMAFDVIDEATGDVALSGTTSRRTGDVRDEWTRGDLTGAEVHEADFSELDTAGRYRVCVADIGCSESFSIDPESTWRRSAVAVARAMYHQRSGIELGPPYTAVVRPRPFHPDDGSSFALTTLTMLDDPSRVGVDDRFGEYAGAVTGEIEPDAGGGHFDAGDWNSRIQHLEYVRVVLDLVRLYPGVFADLDIDIPESGDRVPDLIDEGLWTLDLFRRLQTSDGGVPGNVDQGRFSEGEETSWDNDIEVYVFAPDVWSTYIYAGVAAKTALVLEPYDPERAQLFGESARLAMSWAEANRSDAVAADERIAEVVRWQRATAAVAMLALDGDDGWNDVFATETQLDQGPFDSLGCHESARCTAVWEYAELPASLTRSEMHDNAVESIRVDAETLLDAQETSAFAWNMELQGLNPVWGLGPSIPHGYGLLRAYVVTGDERYRTAMVRSASFSLGGNPLNTSFATGLGANTPRYPLIVDAIHAGLPVWPGTFEFGVHDLRLTPDDDWVETDVLEPLGSYPAALDVPVLWSWYDMSPLAMMNEFTVTQSHAAALWTLGVLAATE